MSNVLFILLMCVTVVLREAVTTTIFLVTNPWFRHYLRFLFMLTKATNVTSFLAALLAATLQ